MRAKGHSLDKCARKLQVAKAPKDMLMELCADNQQLTRSLRSMHEICGQHKDVATASLIENWIDETERRTWFLSEIKRDLWRSQTSKLQQPTTINVKREKENLNGIRYCR